MRNFFALTSLSVLFFIVLFAGGCRTTENKPSTPPINIEERLKHAEAVKKSLLRQLEHQKSVDETIRIKEHLDILQDEIEELEKGNDVPPPIKEDEGFSSVDGHYSIYGPIGIPLKITEWVLTKLYILN